MRRQIAVMRAEIGEARRQQREMAGLLGGDADPVVEKAARQAFADKAGDDVPAEVDRVELDMGERVEQRRAAGCRAEVPALRHLARRPEHRALRPGRPRRRHGIADRQRSCGPGRGQRQAGCGFCRRVGDGEDRRRAGGERLSGQRARAAFSTSATWPGTLTLCQTPRTVPAPSIRKVARSMPMYLRPYMLFSTQVPYFSQTSPSTSERG